MRSRRVGQYWVTFMFFHRVSLSIIQEEIGSSWVITPSWFSGSWRQCLHSSSVYSCHLFLISSASVRSIPFLSFIVPIFAWNVLLISLIFLKRSLVFPFLSFPSISLHWSLRKSLNKASGGDGIPVELFQILKDDAVKVLHSICQQIWKTQ